MNFIPIRGVAEFYFERNMRYECLNTVLRARYYSGTEYGFLLF